MKLRKFQVGGAAPEMAAEDPSMAAQTGAEAAPEAEAQAQGGAEQDPMMQIIQAAMQAVQNNDGQLALQVCGALIQMLQQSQSGAAEGAEPVYRRGGKLAYYKCGGKNKIKKSACGSKMKK